MPAISSAPRAADSNRSKNNSTTPTHLGSGSVRTVASVISASVPSEPTSRRARSNVPSWRMPCRLIARSVHLGLRSVLFNERPGRLQHTGQIAHQGLPPRWPGSLLAGSSTGCRAASMTDPSASTSCRANTVSRAEP